MKNIFSKAAAAAITASLAIQCMSFSALADCLTTTSYKNINLSDTEFVFSDDIEFNSMFSFGNSPVINAQAPQKPSAHLYSDYLDVNNSAVYEALKSWINPSEARVDISFPEPIDVELAALPGSVGYTQDDYNKLYGVVMDNCKPGRDSVLFDYPEIFWLDPNSTSIGLNNTSYAYSKAKSCYILRIGGVSITPKIFDSFSDISEVMDYRQKLDSVIYNYNVDGNNTYEKLESIYQQIGENTFYDTEGSFAHTAIGALVEPGAVCEGYSKAFKLLCDREDIPCVLIFGNLDEKTLTAHMWNYVLMEDNKWYGIDLTWDDTTNPYSTNVDRDYFLKGADTFYKKHTEFRDFLGTIFTYPELNDCEYDPENAPVYVVTEPASVETTEYSETTTEIISQTTSETVTETTCTTTETTADISTETTTEVFTTTDVTTTENSETTTVETTSEFETQTTESQSETEPVETTIVTTTETTIPEVQKGDFNGDGYVDIADAVLCKLTIIGRITIYNCDYNEDNIVDIFDLILFRKQLVEDSSWGKII